MDVTTALAALGQALSIAKDLKEIDKSFDTASVKANMADLLLNLADVKIALSEAKDELHAKDREIARLEEKIASLTSGEACPICSEGRMKTISIKKDRIFGAVGIQEKLIKCDKCGHQQSVMMDSMSR